MAKTANRPNWLYVALMLAVPIVIFFYFLRWKTGAIYGDDLSLWKGREAIASFSDVFNPKLQMDKFRPINRIAFLAVSAILGKNLYAYYVFNIGIQSVNTYIFASILNLFLSSRYWSLLYAILLTISRFALFNVTQIFNGGALEGLALTWCLLSMFQMFRLFIVHDEDRQGFFRGFGWALFFANLAVYTHERYIVIFPFIVLLTMLFRTKDTQAWKQKLALLAISGISLVGNFWIKVSYFHVPFFIGTGGTHIEFSQERAGNMFLEAVKSIAGINEGPDFLVGQPYRDMGDHGQAFALVLFASSISIILIYSFATIFTLRKRTSDERKTFLLFALLPILLVLLLIPAVVTIRLEQRWLQASYELFLLMLVIAIVRLPGINKYVLNAVLAILFLLVLLVDNHYLELGADKMYLQKVARIAHYFKKQIDDSKIVAASDTLAIVGNHLSDLDKEEIKWTLGDGYFFTFYQGKSKHLKFVAPGFLPISRTDVVVMQ